MIFNHFSLLEGGIARIGFVLSAKSDFGNQMRLKAWVSGNYGMGAGSAVSLLARYVVLDSGLS